MNIDQFNKYKNELSNFNSTHVKIDKVEYNNEKEEMIVEVIQMPRGIKITLTEIPSDKKISDFIKKAEYMIKHDASKDLSLWLCEK